MCFSLWLLTFDCLIEMFAAIIMLIIYWLIFRYWTLLYNLLYLVKRVRSASSVEDIRSSWFYGLIYVYSSRFISMALWWSYGVVSQKFKPNEPVITLRANTLARSSLWVSSKDCLSFQHLNLVWCVCKLYQLHVIYQLKDIIIVLYLCDCWGR